MNLKTVIIGILLVALGVGAFFVVGCEKEAVEPDGQATTPTDEVNRMKPNKTDLPSNPTSVNFITFPGKDDLGDIKFEMTATELIIRGENAPEWFTLNSYVYAGDVKGVPIDASGDPIVAEFPMKQAHKPRTRGFEYRIDLSTMPDCFVVFVHGEQFQYGPTDKDTNQTTAWAEGKRHGAKGAQYIEFCKSK